MKAGLVTFYHLHHYGAILQAVATQRALASLGWECETIDYFVNQDIRILKPPTSPGRAANAAYNTLHYPALKRRWQRFESFSKAHLSLTSRRYESREALERAALPYDLLISGSDQIWNPTIFPDDNIIVSAGNFHGEPIAMPMDYLALALTELSNISERRIYKLIGGTRGLPSFLVANPGLNSGFMITQYTAASIVNQSKGLCWPTSCDSIPSSQGQEDHVSMGSNSATKLVRVLDNTVRVLAIELMVAAQALEFRRPLKSSPDVEALFQLYRQHVPFVDNDTFMAPLLDRSIQFVEACLSQI